MENERKYEKLKRVMAGNQQEQVIVMGDMISHIGVLREEVNRMAIFWSLLKKIAWRH